MRARAKKSARPGGVRLLLKNRLAAWGLAVFALVCLLALAAPLLPLADPNATAPANRLLPPLSPGRPLGTDALGRDLLSRLAWGSRVSLAVGISATLIAAAIGSLIGLVAGYVGGRTDAVLMRLVDMVMAFPYILLALVIVAALGPGLLNALYAVAIVNVPFFARNIRGATRGFARREFAAAARLSGKSGPQILFGEILPNVMPIIIVAMSTTVGWMILETAGLSFLGLGAQPPQADLGSMLGEGRKVIFTSPHASVIPGLMIFTLVMAVNLIGDGARDALDPRLKSGALARSSARTEVAESARTADGGAPDPDAALEARDVRVEFRIGDDVYKAVNGFGALLRKGECLGVVGESGSGKSVSALSLAGLVPSPPGRIVGGAAFYRGESLFAASEERLRQLRGAGISHVFQDSLSALHPLIPVGDQIAEAISAHDPAAGRREAHRRAEEMLRLTRISNPAARMKSRPHELSGGMRQRVCIAIALAARADVIIADEPTTALDVTVQARILSLMGKLRRERGAATLFITHDLGVVSAICDRIIVMYAGQIVEAGKTGEILAAPAHPYTAKLIACVPVPGRRLETIEGAPPAANQIPQGCAFAARCSRSDENCRAAPVPISDLGGGRLTRCLHPLTADA